MKKVLKRILIVLLIVLIINNFFITNISNAGVDEVIENLLGAVVGILTLPFRLLILNIGKAINSLVTSVALLDGGDIEGEVVTPFDIVFNKIGLVDINFFDIDDSDDSIVMQIRTGVATWYYIMRLIALAILLVILIYVGIRMAISTVASDQARYKKMLVDWVSSVVIVFLLHYIIIFTLNVNSALVSAIENASTGIGDVNSVYQSILEIGTRIADEMSIAATVIYVILMVQTIGLLISYINRLLKVAFLIIIAPLITITYSIDKMGDGKAQALNTWLKEFVFTILMQPFHCVIYASMVSIAFSTLTTGGDDNYLVNSIFAIMCILFVKEAEKIVRRIFHFEDDDSKTSMAAGMAGAAVAVSQAKNIGKAARTGVNGIRNVATSTKKAITGASLNTRAAMAYLSGHDTGKTFAEVKEEVKEADIEKQNKNLQDKVGNDDTAKLTANTARANLSKEDKERYDEIKKSLGSNATHSQVMARLRNEKLKENTRRGKVKKTINGAKTAVTNSFAGQVAREIANSETYKNLKTAGKTVIAGSLGGFTAFAMMGTGQGVVQSGMAGAAAYGSTKEFFKSSHGTITKSAASNLARIGCKNKEDAKAQAELSKVENENGDYENNSNKMNDLIKNIEDQLKQLGLDDSVINNCKNNITSELQANTIRDNPKSLEEICKSALEGQKMKDGKPPITDFSSIASDGTAIKDYSDFQNRKAFYNNFQNNALPTGITWDQYVESGVSKTAGETRRLDDHHYFGGNESEDGPKSTDIISKEDISSLDNGLEFEEEAILKMHMGEDEFNKTMKEARDEMQKIIGTNESQLTQTQSELEAAKQEIEKLKNLPEDSRTETYDDDLSAQNEIVKRCEAEIQEKLSRKVIESQYQKKVHEKFYPNQNPNNP